MKTHFPRQQEADRCSRVNITLGHYLQRQGGANGPSTVQCALPLWRNLSAREEFELKVDNRKLNLGYEGEDKAFLNLILYRLTDDRQLMGEGLVRDSC